ELKGIDVRGGLVAAWQICKRESLKPGVWKISTVLVFLLSLAHAANAQTTGSLHGKVVDAAAFPLPGARVTLEGPGIPQVQVSDNQGEFDFDGIPRGR